MKVVSIFLLASCLSSCGGSKKHSETINICSNTPAYQGAAAHPPVDVAVYAEQPTIDKEQALSPALVASLEQKINWITANTQATKFSAAIGIPGDGLWYANRGLASNSAAIFWWMSVGKMFTAAVIMQLEEEGKLDLSEPINRWFPQIAQGKIINIAQLLQHTSGIYSFQNEPAFRQQTSYQTPTQLLEFATKHKLDFCPGTAWGYSNTGYVMLGLIIEQIEQKPYTQVIDERILRPLKLTRTRALKPDELPGDLVMGVIDSTSTAAEIAPSTVFSAGNIIGPADELLIFLQAVLTGKLFSAQHLQEALRQAYPMYDAGTFYGRGIMLYDITQASQDMQWIGHSGGSQSANSLIAFDMASGAYVAVVMNDNTSAAAVANKLLEAVKAL